MTWPNANQMAISEGSHLVTIGDAVENNYVYNISPSEEIWLGLTDQLSEGNWEWVTGEPLIYTNWSAGEPNGLTNENYGLFWQSNGEWNDAGDSNNLNRRFIIEFDSQNNYVWYPNGETTPTITVSPTSTTLSLIHI